MLVHMYDLSVSFIVLDSVQVLERIAQFTSLGILDKQFLYNAICEPYLCMLF